MERGCYGGGSYRGGYHLPKVILQKGEVTGDVTVEDVTEWRMSQNGYGPENVTERGMLQNTAQQRRRHKRPQGSAPGDGEGYNEGGD